MNLYALSVVLAAPLLMSVTGEPPVQNGGEVRALVEAQAQQLSELRIELTETRDLLDASLVYMQSQAKAAKALEGSLSEAESLGFTAGINAKSRVALLRGWRGYLGELQSGVPKSK